MRALWCIILWQGLSTGALARAQVELSQVELCKSDRAGSGWNDSGSIALEGWASPSPGKAVESGTTGEVFDCPASNSNS